MNILIRSTNANTYLPFVNNQPDYTGVSEPALSILQAAFATGNYEIIDTEPVEESAVPNWDGFYDQLKNSNVYNYLLSQTIPYPSISGVMAVMGFSIKDGQDDPVNPNRIASLQASVYAVLMALNAVGIPLSNEHLTEVRTLLDDNGFNDIQLGG